MKINYEWDGKEYEVEVREGILKASPEMAIRHAVMNVVRTIRWAEIEKKVGFK